MLFILKKKYVKVSGIGIVMSFLNVWGKKFLYYICGCRLLMNS